MSELILEEPLTLRRPVLVAAFAGWPDAAESSTRAVDFLRVVLDAGRAGAIAPDGFYDLTSTRPTISVRRGVVRGLEYPGTTLYAWHNEDSGGHDLLLLQGHEPSLRWPAYVEAVLEVVTRCDVQMIYSLGSLYDGVPHTRAVRTSMAVAQPELRRAMERLSLAAVNYEGPGSIHTAILDACRQRNVPAASFWGHVPAYAQVNWNPRVSLALLEVLLSAIELPFDLAPLRGKAAQVDDLLDRLVAADEDLQRQVRIYEQRYDGETSPAALPSAETILSEVEAFLRGGQQEPDQEPDNDED